MTFLSPGRGQALSLAAILTLLGGCDFTKPKVPGAEQRAAARKLADARRLKQACGSAETYDRLKAFTFDEANRLRGNDAIILDRVEASTTLRMEDPVATSRDEQLDVTVCRGQLVLDLPPGIEDAFNGARQVKADVEYSAQRAADGSGLVYQMKGAEPIIYRLAALKLPHGPDQPAVASAPPAPVEEAPPARAQEVAREDPRPVPVQPPLPRAVPRAPREEAVASARPVPPRPPRSEVVAARPLPRARRPEVVAAADPPPAPLRQPVAPPPTVAPANGNAQPTFDCARVTSRVLHMVCADPALAARDRRMSSMFYATLASGDAQTRAALRDSRTRFLAFRSHCANAGCVAQAYDDRMAEIRDIAAGN